MRGFIIDWLPSMVLGMGFALYVCRYAGAL